MNAKHAAYTKVPIAQTRGEIDKMLRKVKADGVRWTDFWSEKPPRAQLEFVWRPKPPPRPVRDAAEPTQHPPMLARFDIKIIGYVSDTDREFRRLHRVLRVYLLGMFEAVESGIISLEEAMLSWTVTSSGRTVAQELLPKLKELPASTATALLEATTR